MESDATTSPLAALRVALSRVQLLVRHVSPLTTTIYTHPSDQEIWASI